jgi:MoxR-like ATPase
MNPKWEMLGKVASYGENVLLTGAPGFGKSWAARNRGLRPGQETFPYPLSEGAPAAELRGHIMPVLRNGVASMEFVDGPWLRAWRTGGRLILDELDKMGPDLEAMLLPVLDNRETASVVIPNTGEIVRPEEGYHCWATMNGPPNSLPPPVLDRFAIVIEIDKPAPDMFDLIENKALRKMAQRTVSSIGPRRWLAVNRLMDQGASFDDAIDAVMGGLHANVTETIKMEMAKETKVKEVAK